MKKQKTPVIQPELFNYSEAFTKLDKRVRSTYIGAEQYVSALDLLQYHGNKKNPTQSWRVTMEYMERQGYSTPSVVYQFEGSDGKKKKATPVVNLETFLRFVQSAEVPEWEGIRQWLAYIGAEQLKGNAQRDRENKIELYKKAGYGDRPEVLHMEAYNEALKEYAALKSTYARLVDNPDWANLANAEYLALFGMMAQQLKEALKSDNIRKALSTEALDTMAFAERRLRAVLTTQQNLTNERIQEIIQVVVTPLGVYLRGLQDLTGKPLLASGEDK